MVGGMSKRLRRLIIVVFAVSNLGGDIAVAADTGGAEATATPPVELIGTPPPFADAVSWSMGLFEQAGFELPPLRYVFHGDDPEACAGRPGVHHAHDGESVIEICTSEMSIATQIMILHETAHAWVDRTLTEDRKATFQRLRGWTHWRNYDAVAWHENGTEQAAEIIVWGLIDRPLAMIRIDQNSCEELDAGYRVLTGEAPLHGFRDAC